MKAIVDGKRYDTDTATKVLDWTNGYYPGDFKYRQKILYLTKNGAWFIYHSGGAMTDLAVVAGSNTYSGSSKIEPVDKEDAYKFLCSHGGVREAEKYFPDKIQDA